MSGGGGHRSGRGDGRCVRTGAGRRARWRCSPPKKSRERRWWTGRPGRELTPESARLSAQIDPRGARTEYRFEYGTACCQAAVSGCTARSRAETIAAGFGDQTRERDGSGLSPATAYYFRVLASNARGGVEGGPVRRLRRCPRRAGCRMAGPGKWSRRRTSTGRRSKSYRASRGGSIQAAADGERDRRGWRRDRSSANRKATGASN